MNLELLAMRFLRFEKRCPVALFERSPRTGIGEPDVLGITQSRYLLEIEIKRSVSDFRANAKKHHIWMRDHQELHSPQIVARWPKQFWFLVPPELVEAVSPLVPEYAGLMCGPTRDQVQAVRVVKPAPAHKESARLTAREMMTLGHCLANQVLSQAERIQGLVSRERYIPWAWSPEI